MTGDDATLIRVGEIGLKGGNRRLFEKSLRRNIRRALSHLDGVELRRLRSRLLVRHPGQGAAARTQLARVSGIHSLSPVRTVTTELEAIKAAAGEVFDLELRQRVSVRSFCIRSNRADKSFPCNSTELSRLLGSIVQQRFPQLTVDLNAPDVVLEVDVRPEGSFLFCKRIPGPGGLPVGTTGSALALLSGGIDSPVASFLAMKRGLSLSYVFFHSPEFTGLGALKKVQRLVRILATYQPRTRLYAVPFAQVQTAVKEHAEASYRTVLYRRMMHHIAERLAAPLSIRAVVTGDNLGQVASQTLENLEIIQKATRLMMLRPLLAYDKEEIVNIARKIRTYEASVVPEPDCCTLFQPQHPVTRGDLGKAEANERTFDVEFLVKEALDATEQFDYNAQGEEIPPRSTPGGPRRHP